MKIFLQLKSLFLLTLIVIMAPITTNAQWSDITGFENGLGIWIDGGSDAYRLLDNNPSLPGSYCLRLRDNSGISSSIYTRGVDLSAYDNLDLSFIFNPHSMERGEDFYFEYSPNGGNTFEVIKSWVSGTDFTNGGIFNEVFNFSRPFTNNCVFRFRCDASSNYDYVYFDDINLSAFSSGVVVNPPNPPNPGPCNIDISGMTPLGAVNGVSYYRFDTGSKKDDYSYSEALAFATLRGGYLPMPKDPATNSFLRSQLGKKDEIWIGLTDVLYEGVFVWNDGTPLVYSDWRKLSPSKKGYNDDYVLLKDDGWDNEGNKADADFVIVAFDEGCVDVVSPPLPCGYDLAGLVPLGGVNGVNYYSYDTGSKKSDYSYAEALAVAVSRGGYLPMPKDPITNAFLKSVLNKKDGVWLGLSDVLFEGVFLWNDGTTPLYTDWKKLSPKYFGSYYDYVLLEDDGWSNVAQKSDADFVLIAFDECNPIVYDCPTLQVNYGDACNDGNPNTTGDVITSTCQCVGSPVVVYDCPSIQAYFGDSCDDGNPNTTNDQINANCQCAGTLVQAFDCPVLGLNVGDACNDGNSNTVNDKINNKCQCVGEFIQTYDCPEFRRNIGDLCNDENPATNYDVINDQCKCVGLVITTYDCPTLQVNFGTPCDDGDANTTNDIINNNCNCVGTPVAPPCSVDLNGLVALGAVNGVAYYRLPVSGFKTNYSYSEAFSIAVSRGGFLPMPKDPVTNAFLKSQLNKKDEIWLGLTDLLIEDVFVWNDGTFPLFTDWDKKSPLKKGNNYDYVLLEDGGWDNVSTKRNADFVLIGFDENCIQTVAPVDPVYPCGYNLTGLVPLGGVNGVNYYSFDTGSKKDDYSYSEALAIAVSRGGYLPMPKDPVTNAFLKSRLSKKDEVWIGLTDVLNEGLFIWNDGTPLLYSDWRKLSPSKLGYKDDYVLLKDDGWDNEGAKADADFVIIAFDDCTSTGGGTTYDCASLQANIGAPCNDGNPNTTDDVITSSCTCAGTAVVTNDCYTLANNQPFDVDPWGIWTAGGYDCARTTLPYIWNTITSIIDPFNLFSQVAGNSHCVRIRDNSGRSSSILSRILGLGASNKATIEFQYLPESMERGEDFFLEYSLDGGNSFLQGGRWISGTDFSNGNLYQEKVEILANFTNNTVFRFRCDASSNYDRIYLDNINIFNCDGVMIVGDDVVSSEAIDDEVENVELEADIDTEIDSRDVEVEGTDIFVFPNPATAQVTVKGLKGASYNVLDLSGQVIIKGSSKEVLDISTFDEGIYLIRTEKGDTKKFIKI